MAGFGLQEAVYSLAITYWEWGVCHASPAASANSWNNRAQPLPSSQALLHIFRLDVQQLVALLMESPL